MHHSLADVSSSHAPPVKHFFLQCISLTVRMIPQKTCRLCTIGSTNSPSSKRIINEHQRGTIHYQTIKCMRFPYVQPYLATHIRINCTVYSQPMQLFKTKLLHIGMHPMCSRAEMLTASLCSCISLCLFFYFAVAKSTGCTGPNLQKYIR